MSTTKQNSPELPTDLILQIFSRLPVKSVARFRCLSKQWTSLLKFDCPYFNELFLTQSTTWPRLLFAVANKDNEKWFLYSCPQPQILYKNPNSSLSVTAEFHMPLPKTWIMQISPPVSGLIYFDNRLNFNTPMLCNPSTGHIFLLPHLIRARQSYFGYDLINEQFSVLAISHSRTFPQGMPSIYQILTLRSGRLSWRNIKCPLHHYPLPTNICINEILYYIANFEETSQSKIVCFDLNSEEFNFIDQPFLREPERLVNFKGKLGGIDMRLVIFSKKRCYLELSLWILEDVKKQEWSKYVYVLPSRGWNTKLQNVSIVGVTTTSEVVLSSGHITNPLYVYFFNLEKNILRRVQIKGFEAFQRNCFYGCVDYIEGLGTLNWS